MAETQTLKTLQRVIFPSAVETDVVPLYVDAGVAAGVQLPTRIDGDATTSITEAAQIQEQSAANIAANRTAAEGLIGRRSINVNPGQSLSFGTYFNAFPACLLYTSDAADE